MYESYTRQVLPSKEYRELLGSAICVFNSNNAFVIENILHTNNDDFDWFSLIDKESGKLRASIKATITAVAGDEIEVLFAEIVEMRNRIIHSFQITYGGEQILATKTKVADGNVQFKITKEYLRDFIKKNQRLSDLLYQYRKTIQTVA